MNVHLERLKQIFPTTFATRQEVDKALDKLYGLSEHDLKISIYKPKTMLEEEYFALLNKMAELATIIDETNRIRKEEGITEITYTFSNENYKTLAAKAAAPII